MKRWKRRLLEEDRAVISQALGDVSGRGGKGGVGAREGRDAAGLTAPQELPQTAVEFTHAAMLEELGHQRALLLPVGSPDSRFFFGTFRPEERELEADVRRELALRFLSETPKAAFQPGTLLGDLREKRS